MKKLSIFIFCIIVMAFTNSFAQQEFEFLNNFLQNVSFNTGQDEGIEQNLNDNFGWMQVQGYTHLRFFGIYPNGYHTFPSPTLDAHNFPTNATLEATLEILVEIANQYDITVNFDGWEVLAESNRDTTLLGVGYLTEEEVAAVVQEVLSLGVNLITEEQFGGSYLQAIQSVTSQMGATHETTAEGWWTLPSIADEQLSSVFSFYHYDQTETESILSVGSYPPSNLGNLQASAESAHYYGYPFSIAVGSFGSLETENWKNVLLFAQILHLPERLSIEETNTDFLIWDPNFNFMDYAGSEILSFAGQSFGERPVANLVLDSAWKNEYFRPAFNASIVNKPAIVNTLTLLGYRVIVSTDSVLPDAELYYLQLAGGANSNEIVPLPDYVFPLLNGDTPVFLQPAFGIPDENDATDWIPVRNFFGLPSGDTQTLLNSIPETVIFNDFTTRWGGVDLYITPRIEYLRSSQVDSSVAHVVLSGEIYQEEIALIIRNDNKFLINSNVIHLEAAFILSAFLGGPLNVPATADIVIADGKTLIFAEYDAEIDINLPWAGITRVMRYDPQGNRILDADINLEGNYSETLLRGEFVFLMDVSSTSISNHDSSDGKLPGHLSLFQNYPNPFNPDTNIEYSISKPSNVRIEIFNSAGQKIRELRNKNQLPGLYTVQWDGKNENGMKQSTGSYYYRIQTEDFSKVKKMLLVK